MLLKTPVLKIVVVFIAIVFRFSVLSSVVDTEEGRGADLFENSGYSTEVENPLDILVEGEGAAADDGFGWNVSFIGDIDDDGYEDFAVGAPFSDAGGNKAGRLYIFLGDANADKRTNISAQFADLVITGQPDEGFGWDMDYAGDVNNDGVDDLVVGAPMGGFRQRGNVYIFYGSASFSNKTSVDADRVVAGKGDWGSFGFSVTGCGDLDGDNYDDIAAGAPTAAQAAIYKGYQDQPTTWVDMWDDNTSTPNVTDFTIEVNNTDSDINTFGIYDPYQNSDDGWDWDDTLYVYGGGGTATTTTYYSPDELGGADSGTITPGRREIGGILQGPQTDAQDSLAWGVQVNITTAMNNSINNGFKAFLSFDWAVNDPSAGGTEEPVYVKARAGQSNATMQYLGQNIDGGGYWMRYGGGGGSWNLFMDPEPEIWHYRAPNSYLGNGGNFGTIRRIAELDVTRLINQAGPFYIDVGLMMYSGSALNGGDEGIRGFFGNFSLRLERQNYPIWIQGGGGFGWDVDGGLDVDNDNSPDLIVSDVAMDPYSGNLNYRGTVYLFPGKADLDYVWYSNATDMFFGNSTWSWSGYSISMVPDLNGDGFDEIIAGAPFGDQVNLWWGRAGPPIPTGTFFAPWDDNPGGVANVTFEVEVNNTAADINTFGIYPNPNLSDDGWDWDTGVNVYGSRGTVNTLNYFSAPEPGGSDTGTLPPRGDTSRIGAEVIGLGANDARGAAWGCQFNVTSQMLSKIDNGGLAYLYFDYEVWDREVPASATEEPCYIKARAGNSNNTMEYLGGDMDGQGFWMWQGQWYWFDNPEPEVWHYRNGQNLGGGTNFGTHRGTAFLDMTDTINQTGAMYIDLGILMQTGGQGAALTEGLAALFDNITIEFLDNVATPDVTIQGAPGELFGHSVAYLTDISSDPLADIIVGCPNANNSAGSVAGATYVFFGSSGFSDSINASTGADLINYGTNATEGFGFAVGGSGSVSGGALSTPLVGCPAWRNTTGDANGKAYVLGIPPDPVITVTYPNGGETVNGTITLTCTARDPNGDIDLATGITFELQEDGTSTWTQAGVSTSIGPGDVVQLVFDTTTVQDGDYWLQASVIDLLSHFSFDLSDNYFTIDNPWEPVVNITTPTPADSLNTTVGLNAKAVDVDGVLNYSKGVTFYYSLDNGTTDPWKVAGVDNVSLGDTFTYNWDISGISDGLVYLNATVEDDEGLVGFGYSSFTVLNPKTAPIVTITNPWNASAELLGNVVLNATVFDAQGDIPNSNITFYYSKEGEDWVEIGKALSSRGVDFYQTWDSIGVEDGLYAFKVEAIDGDGLSGEDITPQFMVHNNVNNAPIVHVIYPNNNVELSLAGVITVTAYVYDLENNLDPNGAQFYYSTDKENWTHLGNDVKGTDNIYKVQWDTNSMPDNFYWIKVVATDTDGNVGEDTSNSSFIIHNNFDNPPIIRVTYPDGGEQLSGTVTVSVWAYDFENNINAAGIVLYYSPDAGKTWEVLGSVTDHTNNVYNVSWDTTAVPDGNQYLINATATDITMRAGWDTSNDTFSIKNMVNSPPTVNLLDPKPGTEVSGEINVSAYAFDLDNDIDGGVKFQAMQKGSGTWVDIGEDTTADVNGNYDVTWDTNTTASPNGIYLIKAEVVDKAGLNATDTLSTGITVNNAGGILPGDNEPTVSITSPENGNAVFEIVSIVANINDQDEDLEKVEFFYQNATGGRELVGTQEDLSSASNVAVTTQWDTNTTATPNGAYHIIVVATDANGNTGESSVSVNIVNQVGGEPPIIIDDDDDEESFLGKYWWLFLIIVLVIVLIIIMILIFVLVRRKKNVEVNIGPFSLFGKPAEGRLMFILDGKEFAGGVDLEGIAHIANVDKEYMGREVTIQADLGDKDYEFPVVLVADKVITPPRDWPKSLKKPEGLVAPKAESLEADARPEAAAPAVARPEDQIGDSIGMPPTEESRQIEGTGQMRALPPAEGEGQEEIEEGEEDVDELAELAELPEDEIELEDKGLEEGEEEDEKEDEDLPPLEAGPEMAKETPDELDEDDIDLDLGLDELEIDMDEL